MLARLEAQPRALRRGTIVRRQHDRAGDLFIVQQGWLHSFTLLGDGSRQIVRLHIPGDLIGTSGTVQAGAGESIACLTDVSLCTFDRAVLRGIFVDHPRLAALVYQLAQADLAALTERLASLGRTSARARIAALLLETIDRLRMVTPDLGTRFAFPLTQEEIGDATGLTAVHVNRMIRALAEDGLIARSNATVTLLDERRLARIAQRAPRTGAFDTGWLPDPA